MPDIKLKDLRLANVKRTERVEKLRTAYFRAVPEVCTRRALSLTEYCSRKGLFAQPRISNLNRAKLLHHVLDEHPAIVWPSTAVANDMTSFSIEGHSLFAGTTTTKFKGIPTYPEFIGTWIWPELELLRERPKNPYFITKAEIDVLNQRVFPYWIDKNVTELGRARQRKQQGRDDDAPDFKLLERIVFFITTKPNCISHTIPSFKEALAKGLDGIITDARAREAAAQSAEATTQDAQAKAQHAEARDFYAGVVEVMTGIVDYSRRLAAEARRLAATAAPLDKQELLELADIHDRVPAQPARTFREGLTTVWMCWIALHLENANAAMSLGRLDQFLYSLYEADITAHRLAPEEAVELLCCFWLKIGDHVPMVPSTAEKLFGGTGSNQAITIGGVDSKGENAVNDLTYVVLRATELMMLRDPNLNARYYPGTDKKSTDYLHRLCEVNLSTAATPALHNDRAAIAALVSAGETIEEARDYGIVGCVEPISSGRTFGHTGAILLNLVSALELTLFGGRRRIRGAGQAPDDFEVINDQLTADATTLRTFHQLKELFLKHTQWLVRQTVGLNTLFGQIHQDFFATPILSSLFEGPMEKGKDVTRGGATKNSSGVAIIGFADVVDSLAAIEHLVFGEKPALRLAELLEAMRYDFAREQDRWLYALLRNPEKMPKFGNRNAKADAIAHWLAQELRRLYDQEPHHRGGHYRVGYWSMTNHAGFGMLSGATPNGRRRGENFASGITPVSGMTLTPADALGSVASLPAELLVNGVALNIKFPPVASADRRGEMVDRVRDLVAGYFQGTPANPADGKPSQGGMEIQFNITSREDFIAAQKDPAAYPELLVRVSGYTAYFKDLNAQMQNEIIERTEYGLLAGQTVNLAARPRVEDGGAPT